MAPATLRSSVVTAGGKYVHRNKVRAAFRIVSFLGLVGFFWATAGDRDGGSGLRAAPHRRLDGEGVDFGAYAATLGNGTNTTDGGDGGAASTCATVADPLWLLAPLIAGVLYMFVALAVVCDEYFVPALEEMAGPKHMDLSMDIAGATLMAAGGSAPELFTSFVGTFQESSVGFGTIIGSAVFNVLFVIGTCAVCAPNPLELTWWPLFRDCTYYSVTLIFLAIFFADKTIQWWEALVLFLLYLGYILVMYFNVSIYTSLMYIIFKKEITEEDLAEDIRGDNVAFYNPSMFRMGIVHYLSQPGNVKDSAGVHMVTQIRGDVHDVFAEFDQDHNGFIDVAELHELFARLGCEMREDEIEEAMKELDTNGDGQVDKEEFSKWYLSSEQRIRSQIKKVFDDLDENGTGRLRIYEIASLFTRLNYRLPSTHLEAALAEIRAAATPGADGDAATTVTYVQFEAWYKDSLFWTAVVDDAEHMTNAPADTIRETLRVPDQENTSVLGYVGWVLLLPIVGVLFLTVPDVRKPGNSSYCYLAFFMSIAWIGIMSYFMVLWTEVIGNTFDIPSILMGMTFIAAGTSVPDLLSSVVVAKKGFGDMAVSSSIGSNIFDITVGLPVPWLAYIIFKQKKVEVVADNVLQNILILLCMLLAVIVTIMANKWTMSKLLGGIMFGLYLAYLIQAIAFALPFDPLIVCGGDTDAAGGGGDLPGADH